jgi:hypothetical protein
MKPKLIKIADIERIETAKAVIIDKRKVSRTCASYELYGILYSNNRLVVERVNYAPIASDFAAVATKANIAGYLKVYDMVAEFRGAWKSDAEAKVIAYELQPSA